MTMRNTMKMTLAALASLALLPTAVTAHTVKDNNNNNNSSSVTCSDHYPERGETRHPQIW
ncbi:hypothetical protein [Archangium sp.]|uniref:hypothetical protein n=1 Tax=Archangium sp. TaxID=1872627 RepID=UPI002D5E07A3|nr:hypothetical protein [Archangium sp.]HYO57095.1 hypothetical protein [Archangium sp.]